MSSRTALINTVMVIVLLVAFGFTAFRYFAIAMSTGILDLAYLVAIWVLLVFSTRLRPVIGYAISCLLGVMLTFPLSLFVHISEAGNVSLTDGDAFATMIGGSTALLWIAEYVAVAVIAQAAIRTLWRPQSGSGLAVE